MQYLMEYTEATVSEVGDEAKLLTLVYSFNGFNCTSFLSMIWNV